MTIILQLNCALSSDVPDTVRLEPAGTGSPFEGDTIFTNALAKGKSPVVAVKDSTKAIITIADFAQLII